MFISRRCYAVYDLRRQAPTTTTTRIPDPRTYLPPVGCPTSFFYPPRLLQERKEKKYATNFPPFSLRLPFQLSRVYLRPSVHRCWRALLLTLCVLPFCKYFLHAYIRSFHIRTYFLSAISFRIRTYGDSTYVHTPTPHSILRFRPAPQTPDLHTSNLPLVRCNVGFVPLVESGICLLVDVATLSTNYDVRHPLLLPPGYLTQELISRP